MSKMDALRAMREARYAETTARAAKTAAAKPAGPKPAAATPATARTAGPKTAAAEPAAADPGSAPVADELCGHRNMGGRSCTREKGHAAKSHRYS
jgi:hypothetical protein